MTVGVDKSNDGRRGVLRTSTDSRAVRTRQCIAAALQLLAHDGEEINVSSLVRQAGISRGTFYTHYSGLEELAEEMQATAVHEIAQWERHRARLDPLEGLMSRKESISEALGMLAAHYAEYRRFYAAVFSVPATLQVRNVLVDALIAELLEHMINDVVVPENVNPSIAATHVAGGWMAILSEWVMGRIEACPEEIAQHLVELAPSWIYVLRSSPENK